MKLNIKTSAKNTLAIDVQDTITVYDLKKELSLYPSVGVEPPFQKIVCGNKILKNSQPLSAYKIDAKTVLNVTILKKPQEEEEEEDDEEEKKKKEEQKKSTKAADATAISQQKLDTEMPTTSKAATSASKVDETADHIFKEPLVKSPTASANQAAAHEQLVESIVNMGYKEKEVRRSLAASFNNPERAIEYLIEGIPTSPSTPGSCSSSSAADYTSESDISPHQYFRTHSFFRKLKANLSDPDLTDQAIKRISEVDETVLEAIDEHPAEFLKMLIESPNRN